MPTISELTRIIESSVSNNQWRITNLFSSSKVIGNSESINFTSLLSAHYLCQCSSNNRVITIARQLMKSLLKDNNSSQWNYHCHNQRYPNDLDDTIIATSVLLRTKLLPKSEVITNLIKNLIAVENEPGGPYRTWFVDKLDSDWGSDVDPIINYRVQDLLKMEGITLKRLTQWLQTQAIAGTQSLYYSGFEQEVIYAASTNHWQWQKLVPSNPYEAAVLLIIALNQHGCRYFAEIYDYYRLLVEMSVEEITAAPAFINRIHGNAAQWGGSALLTRSACLAAITLFQQKLCEQNHAHIKKTIEQGVSTQIDTLLSHVPRQHKTKVKARALALNHLFHSPALHLVTRQLIIDATPMQASSKQLHEKLIAATILGWIAYSLHDTNIDSVNAATSRSSLAVSRMLALLAQKCFLDCCDTLTTQEASQLSEWIKTIFIEMEQTYCIDTLLSTDSSIYLDWDEYLYKRSAGLVIAPVLLCILNNSRLTLKQMISVYKPLIIARQILDDVHDFDDDHRHNRVTFLTSQFTLDKESNSPTLTQKQRAVVQKYTFVKISNCLKQALQQVTKLPNTTHEIFMPEVNRLQSILDQQATTIAVVTALTTPHQEEKISQKTHLTISSPPAHTTANRPSATEYSSRVGSRSTG